MDKREDGSITSESGHARVSDANDRPLVTRLGEAPVPGRSTRVMHKVVALVVPDVIVFDLAILTGGDLWTSGRARTLRLHGVHGASGSRAPRRQGSAWEIGSDLDAMEGADTVIVPQFFSRNDDLSPVVHRRPASGVGAGGARGVGVRGSIRARCRRSARRWQRDHALKGTSPTSSRLAFPRFG